MFNELKLDFVNKIRVESDALIRKLKETKLEIRALQHEIDDWCHFNCGQIGKCEGCEVLEVWAFLQEVLEE